MNYAAMAMAIRRERMAIRIEHATLALHVAEETVLRGDWAKAWNASMYAVAVALRGIQQERSAPPSLKAGGVVFKSKAEFILPKRLRK